MPGFRYELPPRRGRDYEPPPTGRPEPLSELGLNLTGQVRGKKASDLEEIFARALEKSPKVVWWKREQLYGAPSRNAAGAKTLDYLVYTGVLYPIQIDDEWIHKSAATKAKDAMSDAFIFQKLASQGPRPVRRIKGNELRDGRRASQEKADKLVREMF